MAEELQTFEQALAEIEDLRARLEEAEEGLNAIRNGEVDAVVVSGPEGEQIYTLTGAERTYRILVEAMNEGALVLSPEGSIVYSNRTFAAMLGTPIYEVLGHSIYDFVAEADVKPLKKMLQQAQLYPGRKEINLKNNGISSVPAFVSVANLDTEDGPAVSAVVTDLTESKRTEAELAQYREHLEELVVERTKELAQANAQLQEENEQRKQVEQALRESEERFRALVIASSEVLYRMNPDWSEMRQLQSGGFLASTEKPISNWLQEYIHPDDQPHVTAVINEAIRTKSVFELEHRVRRVDGSLGWTFSRAIPVMDVNGEIVEWFGAASDITKRKQAEQQLARARVEAENWAARLESFIASMADGITLLDANGKVIVMNDAGKKIVGIPLDEPYDDWFKYQRYSLDGKPIPLEESAAYRALHGETIREERYREIGSWGKTFIISISASPVFDSDGRITGATCVFRDVTDLVDFEQQKQELYEREHRISEMLQQALVPSQIPYDLRGITVAARYQPALREAEVGGDFYDVFKLGEDKLGVLIGDIAGKGLNAAIRVAEIRHAVRSYAYLGNSPGEVMTLANEALLFEDDDMAHALTAFFAVIDNSTGTMTYSCAGHEPPIICNPGGNIEELRVTGMMLGIVRGMRYGEETRVLNAGDTVVMLTDGITEARRDGYILFEKQSVIEVVKKMCDASPDEVAEGLLQAATTHAGGSLQDDVAIVVLGYRHDKQD